MPICSHEDGLKQKILSHFFIKFNNTKLASNTAPKKLAEQDKSDRVVYLCIDFRD